MAVFPMKYFNPEKTFEQMREEFNQALANATEKYIWNYSYEFD